MKRLQISRTNRSGTRGNLQRRQRGVVLFVALIVLVVMSLGGISMMRAADTGTQIAGNLAFRQSALQAAERAFEQAMQNVSLITSGGNNRSDNAALCYSATYLDVGSTNDLPWQSACDLGADSVTGNRVQLIINRLSVDTFGGGTKTPAGVTPGNNKRDYSRNPFGFYQHFRVIARVSDTKGMVTFIEEKIY